MEDDAVPVQHGGDTQDLSARLLCFQQAAPAVDFLSLTPGAQFCESLLQV